MKRIYLFRIQKKAGDIQYQILIDCNAIANGKECHTPYFSLWKGGGYWMEKEDARTCFLMVTDKLAHSIWSSISNRMHLQARRRGLCR